MAKIGTVVIEIDANTAKLVEGVKESNKRLSTLQKSANNAKKTLLSLAGAAASLYGLSKAYEHLIKASFEYNVEMENSTVKLEAMISASKGYETVSGKQVTTLERQALIAAETTETMVLLKKANLETAMGMKDLIDVFALMKPGMDQVNIATKDQVEILKLVTNTASTFGLSAQELSTGVDDLAKGTWKTSQSFGKMMTAIGVTTEGMKNAADKVEYLKEKMAETGVAQDTWAVAVSNFGVAWDETIGKLTVGIFDNIKNAVKDVTELLSKQSPEAMQIFADALVDMINGGVKTVAFLIKAFNQLIGVMQISYAGYMKMAGVIGGGDVKKLNDDLKELNRVQKEGDYGMFSNQNRGVVRAEISALEKKIEKTKEYNDIRANGDKLFEDAAKRTDAINTMVDNGVKKITLSYSSLSEAVTSAKKATDPLKDKARDLETASKKSAKASKAAAKAAAKASKERENALKREADAAADAAKEMQKYNERFSDAFGGAMTDVLDGDLLGAFNGFFKTISDTMVKPFVDDMSKSLSGMLSNLMGGLGALGSFVGGALISGALVFASKLFDKAPTQTLESYENDLGIKDPTSDSVQNILESMDWSLTRDLTYSKGIYDNMVLLVKQSGQAATAIAGQFDLGVKTADVTNSGIFGWRQTTKDIEGQFLKMGSNFYAQLGSEIKQTKEHMWSSDSVNRWTEYSGVGEEANSAIQKAYKAGFESIAKTMAAFDVNDAEALLTDAIAGLDTHSFQVMGKSSEEIAALINSAIGGDLDSIIESVLPWVGKFLDVGEDFASGAGRLVYEMELISKAFEDLGTEFSIFGELGVSVSQAFLDASGGLDMALSNVGGFIDNFYTDAEKQAIRIQKLSVTGLFGDEEEYKAKIKALTSGAAGGDLNATTQLAELLRLQSDYREYYDYIAEAAQAAEEAAQAAAGAIEGMIQDIADAWLGNLSYLSLQQKADFASGYLSIAGNSNGQIDTVEAARLAAETALKSTSTKEEYIPVFDRYIRELENKQEEATLDDVVEEIRILTETVKEQEETIRRIA